MLRKLQAQLGAQQQQQQPVQGSASQQQQQHNMAGSSSAGSSSGGVVPRGSCCPSCSTGSATCDGTTATSTTAAAAAAGGCGWQHGLCGDADMQHMLAVFMTWQQAVYDHITSRYGSFHPTYYAVALLLFNRCVSHSVAQPPTHLLTCVLAVWCFGCT
jgi:hypothetical protein